MRQQTTNIGSRRGLTLTELLVVISIVVLLAAVVLPMMQPVLRGREVREAARQLSNLINQAQARAFERGRPAGILIEPNNGRTFTVRLAEVPPPYSGDSYDAGAVYVASEGHLYRTLVGTTSGQKMIEAQSENEKLLIRFNYRGPLYTITKTSPPTNVYGTRVRLFSNIYPLPPVPQTQTPVSTPPVPFEIYQWPKASVTPPLELPNPAAIDLYFSKAGSFEIGPWLATTGGTVIITFRPDGSANSLYYSHPFEDPNPPFPIISPIYLLVGRNPGIPEQIVLNKTEINLRESNLADPDSVWLAIDHRTGKITVAQNNVPTNGFTGLTFDQAVEQSRLFARQAEGIAGG